MHRSRFGRIASYFPSYLYDRLVMNCAVANTSMFSLIPVSCTMKYYTDTTSGGRDYFMGGKYELLKGNIKPGFYIMYDELIRWKFYQFNKLFMIYLTTLCV